MKDYIELSKKHFNKQAQVYDETNTALYSKYPKISCKDVAKRLKNIQYQALLDIGCGTGYLIDLLQRQKSALYCGLDLSPEMLKMAGKRLPESVCLTEGSSDKLPYEDNSFDIVTCIQSFHHYPNPEKAMEEAYRVLKKGGFYILSDTGYGGILKWFYNQFILKVANTGDYAVYSMNDIENLMMKSGFVIKDAQKIDRFVYTIVAVKR